MYSTMIKRFIIITFMGMGLAEVIAGSPTSAKIQRSAEKMTELRSRGTTSVGTTIFATVVGNALGGIISPKFVALGKKHAEDAEKKKKSQVDSDEDRPSTKKSKSKHESSSNIESISRKEEKVTADADDLPSEDSAIPGGAKSKSLRRRNGRKIRTLGRRYLGRSKLLKGSRTAVGTVGTTALGAAVFNYFFAKIEAENQIKTDKEAKKKSKEDETSRISSDDTSKNQQSEKLTDDSSINTKSEPVGQFTADKPRTELSQDDRQKLAGPP